MRAFLKDLLHRFGKASVFANSGNLGDTLRLIEQRRQEESERQLAHALRTAAWKLMHRTRGLAVRQRRAGAREA
jgi:hypothetical protein